jgi:hypothetical protein
LVRTCKDICFQTRNHHIFSDKALQYDEGSYCPICSIWIRKPTNSKLDIIIECESDAQYYDIEGKPIATKLLYPIKQLVKKVRCICCGTQARGKTHHTNNRLRNKIFNTFEQKVERAPRGISNKKEANNIEEDNIDYGYEESVFDLRGTELQ